MIFFFVMYTEVDKLITICVLQLLSSLFYPTCLGRSCKVWKNKPQQLFNERCPTGWTVFSEC